VHAAPTAIEAPQVVAGVNAKSVAAAAGLGLVIVALVKFTAAALLLVSVTDCAAVAVPIAEDVNVRELGETAKAASVVPESATVCGLEVAPSAMESVAVSAAVPEGVYVTLTVQLAPARMEAPQVVADTAKSAAAAAGLGFVSVGMV